MIQGRAGGNWEYEMSNKASDTLRKIFLFKRSRPKIILNIFKVHKDPVWLYSSSQPKITNVSDPENTEQILRGLDLRLGIMANTLSHLVYCS